MHNSFLSENLPILFLGLCQKKTKMCITILIRQLRPMIYNITFHQSGSALFYKDTFGILCTYKLANMAFCDLMTSTIETSTTPDTQPTMCKKGHPPNQTSTTPCECLLWWMSYFYTQCGGCLCGGCLTIEALQRVQIDTQISFRGAVKKKNGKIWSFGPTGGPPPPPRDLVQKNGKKIFNVYFAFQTILSNLFFHENLPFFGFFLVGTGEPPPSLGNWPNFFRFFFAQPGGNIFGGSNNIMN